MLLNDDDRCCFHCGKKLGNGPIELGLITAKDGRVGTVQVHPTCGKMAQSGWPGVRDPAQVRWFPSGMTVEEADRIIREVTGNIEAPNFMDRAMHSLPGEMVYGDTHTFMNRPLLIVGDDNGLLIGIHPHRRWRTVRAYGTLIADLINQVAIAAEPAVTPIEVFKEVRERPSQPYQGPTAVGPIMVTDLFVVVFEDPADNNALVFQINGPDYSLPFLGSIVSSAVTAIAEQFGTTRDKFWYWAEQAQRRGKRVSEPMPRFDIAHPSLAHH